MPQTRWNGRNNPMSTVAMHFWPFFGHLDRLTISVFCVEFELMSSLFCRCVFFCLSVLHDFTSNHSMARYDWSWPPPPSSCSSADVLWCVHVVWASGLIICVKMTEKNAENGFPRCSPPSLTSGSMFVFRGIVITDLSWLGPCLEWIPRWSLA